jgi:hypothetical protein
MDIGSYLLVGLTVFLVGWAALRDPSLLPKAVGISGRLLQGVWLELLLGFLLAGLIDVLLPAKTIVAWLGSGSETRGIFTGWLVGLALPGGPYMACPIVAGLMSQGGRGPWGCHRARKRQDVAKSHSHVDVRSPAARMARYARAARARVLRATCAWLAR